VITGAHAIIYSTNPDADRAFLRDILKLTHVDVGHGWLIFGLPPAEIACHPMDAGDKGRTNAGHRLLTSHVYLMCDDLRASVAALAEKGVSCTEVQTENWGVRTTIRLPSGGEIGLYQPRHPVAYGLA
jgi:hypothetical protein